MEKIIGVDIDGVLTDTGRGSSCFWDKELSQFVGKKVKRVNNCFDFAKAYELDVDIVESFFEVRFPYIARTVSVSQKASEVLREFKNHGFIIHLITARGKKLHKITVDWLEKNNIPYESLSHTKSKGELATEKKCSLFIEDCAENAVDLLKYDIPVILFSDWYNREWDLTAHDVERVNNWLEVKEYVFQYFNMSEGNIENVS
ncbi:MAG: 5' nucleotidase, NT5C type [bacterium]